MCDHSWRSFLARKMCNFRLASRVMKINCVCVRKKLRPTNCAMTVQSVRTPFHTRAHCVRRIRNELRHTFAFWRQKTREQRSRFMAVHFALPVDQSSKCATMSLNLNVPRVQRPSTFDVRRSNLRETQRNSETQFEATKYIFSRLVEFSIPFSLLP